MGMSIEEALERICEFEGDNPDIVDLIKAVDANRLCLLRERDEALSELRDEKERSSRCENRVLKELVFGMIDRLANALKAE